MLTSITSLLDILYLRYPQFIFKPTTHQETLKQEFHFPAKANDTAVKLPNLQYSF